MAKLANPLTLADWRRQVAEIYAAARHNPNTEAAWNDYRTRRDDLDNRFQNEGENANHKTTEPSKNKHCNME